jgi:formylglycine-generating enzyme required for sulfatase activity
VRVSVSAHARFALLGLVFAPPLACQIPTAPALPEALLVVDTDVAVPVLASRLRVDAFAEDGTWYASRDFGQAQASGWPLTFGVHSPNAASTRRVLLRLRVYTDGAVREYLGERFAPRPAKGSGKPYDLTPVPPSPPGDAPRLLDSGGNDVTPPTEPEPLLAIDRLAIVELGPKSSGTVPITMRGACLGTMADLAALTTCTDTENVRETVVTLAPAAAAGATPASLVATFGKSVPCTAAPRAAHLGPTGAPLYDEEVCVPGGTFIFGSESQLGAGRSDAIPRRVAVVDPLRIDKYEVTVGRWRQAVQDGFTEIPLVNDAPLPTDPADSVTPTAAFCSYSDEPMGRETYPVTCMTWFQARAFCQFTGEDLPLEVQWEYVAAQAGRTVKTPYPWGGPDVPLPACNRTVIGRAIPAVGEQGVCSSMGIGPLTVDALDTATGDVSVGFGVVNLGGNVAELLRDSAESLGSNCWMENALHMPSCLEPGAVYVSIRGASWAYPVIGTTSPNDDVRAEFNTEFLSASPELGLRCVRSGAATSSGGGK